MDPPWCVAPTAYVRPEGADSVVSPARLSVQSSSQTLLDDDQFFAALASAEGTVDEENDPDCAGAVAAIDAAAVDLGRALSERVLAAKSAIAQKAQARQAQMQAEAAAEAERLEGMLEEETAAKLAVEARLARAFVVQNRLADSLHEARESGAARLQAAATLAEWQRSLMALKREAHCERLAPKHHRRTLLRKVLGTWRTASRKLRHGRIDDFWEQAVSELREALQSHYEPRLEALHEQLAKSKAEAAAAWQAKSDLGRELKAAFMKQVVTLNLETASILGEAGPTGPAAEAHAKTVVASAAAAAGVARPSTAPEPAAALGAPPKPIRAEDLLLQARRGLQQAQRGVAK